LRWQHVLFWGGLRGALAPALAISLPAALGVFRGQIQAMVFGVVLFNLLVQGISLGPFVRRLKLVQRTPIQDEYERRHARAVAARSAYAHIEERFREGLISDQTWKTLSNMLQRRHQALTKAVTEVLLKDPAVEAEELDTAWREALRAQRSTYSNLLTDGFITEDTFELLVGEVDLALMESQVNWSTYLQRQNLNEIRSLITVTLPHVDEENTINALNKLGISVTRLQSDERLLQQGDTTLLIGTPEGSEYIVRQIIGESCTQPLKKLKEKSTPGLSENAGTEIFTFEVDRYIEL
jgi:uncharacterized protein YaaQ